MPVPPCVMLAFTATNLLGYTYKLLQKPNCPPLSTISLCLSYVVGSFNCMHRYGPAVSTATFILYWVNVPAVIACSTLLPLYMFTLHGHQLAMEQMTAVWLMPVLPAVVAANTAGTIASQFQGMKLETVSSVIYSGECVCRK